MSTTITPHAFTVGDVSSVGETVVASCYNSTNTDITVVVPIDDDSSLIGGTIQIISSTTSGSGFENLGDPITITGSDLNSDLTITILELTFKTFSQYSEGNVMYFNAIITDIEGDDTTGTESSSTLTIVTLGPEVENVTSTTPNGYYKAGDVINITMEFTDTVFVTTTNGTPQLTLNSGAVVDYTSGTGNAILTFKYTVAAGDISSNLDYDSTSALALNDGTIKDDCGNAAILSLFSPGVIGSLGGNKDIVIDNTDPSAFTVGTVSSVGGTVVDSYFGLSNTGISIVVPINNDNSLIGGVVQILSKKTSGSFKSLGDETTITSSDINTNLTITISNSTFSSFSEYANNNVMYFNAIITDSPGNSTTGTKSNSTLTIFLTKPYFYDITSNSNNIFNNYAKLNDSISLSMTSSTTIVKGPSVDILINGVIVDSMDVYNNSNNWYATYTINNTYNGTVSFLIRDYYNFVYDKGNSIVTSSSITVITKDPISPYVKYFDCYTGSTKTSLNNRIDILFSSDTYKWEHSVNGGVSYSNFTYGSSPGTLYLDKGVYLSGDIIIRNYDIAGNYSELTNSKNVTITSSSTGYPVINASTNKSNKMKKAEYIRIYSK